MRREEEKKRWELLKERGDFGKHGAGGGRKRTEVAADGGGRQCGKIKKIS